MGRGKTRGEKNRIGKGSKVTAQIALRVSGSKTPSSASFQLSSLAIALSLPAASSGQQSSNPDLTLHAVGAPAFPFGVLGTGKVGENGLAFVLLHSPAEVLEARYTHLLVVGHRKSVADRGRSFWVVPPRGEAPRGAGRSCFRAG